MKHLKAILFSGPLFVLKLVTVLAMFLTQVMAMLLIFTAGLVLAGVAFVMAHVSYHKAKRS